MATLAVNATDFSRGLSEFLNQVQYKGQVLDIERGKRIVARVSPIAAADGFPIAQLDDWLARGPQLGCANRQSISKDLRAVRVQLGNRANAWAS
jgi:hypothetical protein